MQDKKSIMFLLAGFMKNPHLLDDKEFHVTDEDFPEKFHKLLYGAMYNLYHSGVEELTPIEIDTYLSTYDMQYKIFSDNDGLEILYRLKETDDLGNAKNMKHHHERVRKFTFLRKCVENGIDISNIIDFSVVDVTENEKQNERFDGMDINELIREVENRIVDIKDGFHVNAQEGSHMAEDAEEMLKSLYESPAYGYNLSSGLLTRIIRGALPSKLVMRSSNTGGGKTRYAIADLCSVCIPELWDLKEKKWVKTGNTEAGLFITTELSKEEIQLPVLCYISGIPEYKILDGDINDAEKKRLQYALKVLENTPLYIEHLSDFDIEDVEHTIERNVIKNDVRYLVFDYIHSSMKMMTTMAKGSGIKMREDQILLLFADK